MSVFGFEFADTEFLWRDAHCVAGGIHIRRSDGRTLSEEFRAVKALAEVRIATEGKV
ncbi:hypothetical protein T261_8502 [Streptomyces lydicus]|nr:hypothetical protein T261_8502 [Streptomyces lydicus]